MSLSQEIAMKLIKNITNVMHALDEHNLKKVKKEIAELRNFSKNFPQNIKDDIQNFITQSDIQKDYDLGHGVSKKLKLLADKIVYDLKNHYI